MGGSMFSDKIAEVLEQNRGKDVSLTTIRKNLGFSATARDDHRIRNAVSGLRTRSGMPIETILRGSVWRLTVDATSVDSEISAAVQDASTEPKIFEKMGNTKSGIILRDENGDMWTAKRM